MRLIASIVALGLLSSCTTASNTTPTALPPPPQAQTTTVASTARTFTPADFARYAPRTAYDMLSRVPGFTIREETDERGLGEATGNVLLNGQRLSGKSNDVITELTRVPGQNVQRIDIVDAATLDVPGLTGQVANVIVKSDAISGQYAYRPEFRAYHTDPLLTRFELSLSGARGPIEYTLGVDNRGNRSGAGGPTWIRNPEGSLREHREEVWRGNSDQPRFSGRLVYDGPGTSVGNLNVSYHQTYYDYLETGTRAVTGEGVWDREVTIDEGGNSHEIGADYEMDLGRGRLKVIGLNRETRIPAETNVLSTLIGGTDIEASRYESEGDEVERIGRSEYRWTDRNKGEWQISAEAAFNSLDNEAHLFERNANGIMVETELEGATARVTEDRYEAVGSYGRPLSPHLTTKLSVGGEYSELVQVGIVDGTRSFYRPKGELSAAWQPSAGNSLNVKLARRVGQLNFYDFLASVNLRDDYETDANPDLVPQQSWELDLEGVRSLGRHGSTTLRLYGQLIDDIIDYIPIGADGESPGNLDSAVVYGIQSASTFHLDAIGWRGTRIDTDLRWQDSEVEDPLTGEKRPISNSLMYEGSVALRQDVPSTHWAWGGSLWYQLLARNYRLTEVGRMWEGPVWGDLFLEHKNVYGLTLRAGVSNLLAADSMWDRTVYVGRRTGAIDYIETRDRSIGPIFSFAVRGKF